MARRHVKYMHKHKYPHKDRDNRKAPQSADCYKPTWRCMLALVLAWLGMVISGVFFAAA